MQQEQLKEFDKELREIYTLTIKIQEKAYSLMRKVEEAKQNAASVFNVGQSGEYNQIQQSEK
jgi:Xaa-Pro aminopeptidase